MIELLDLLSRVRGLVATSGEDREEFARATSIDAVHLSAVLDGEQRLSSLDLALIADAYEVTVDWLLTGVPSVLMRAAHLPVGSARMLVEQADDIYGRREGAAHLGRPQAWRPGEVGPLTGSPVEQGRALAGAALRRVHVAGRDVAEADLPTLVEDVFGVDVAVCDVELGVDGLAVCSPTAKVVVVAATAAAARQRFTVAHELGHLLAGEDPEVLHLDVDVFALGDDHVEIRADAFARCFLMPEAMLRRAADAGLGAEGFVALVGDLGVTPGVLARRLVDLDLIDAQAGERWGGMAAAEAARVGGRSDAFVDAMDRAMTPRTPRLLRRDLYRVYEAHDATLRPFAWSLGLESDRLREMLGADLE